MAAKVNIITACPDEDWIEGVEDKFLDEFKDEELRFITDEDCLKEYFSQPRTAAVLLIDSAFYGEEFLPHHIFRTFVLTEEPPTQSLDESSVKYISKYESLKSVVHQIKDAAIACGVPGKPSLIYFYSPGEGAGAPECAAGAAAELARNHGKKVLYINTGSLQSFGFAAGVQNYLDSYAKDALQKGAGECWQALKPYVTESEYAENWFVVPPFKDALPSLNISEADYKTLALKALESNEFDFVIVSGDSAYTSEKSSFMGISDKIALVCRQDENSAYEFNKFLKLIDYGNDKFVFVINGHDENKENMLKGFTPSGTLRFITVENANPAHALPYLNDPGIYAELAYGLE